MQVRHRSWADTPQLPHTGAVQGVWRFSACAFHHRDV